MMDSPLISNGDFLRQIPSMQGLSSRRIQRRSLSQRMHIDTPLLVLLLLLTLIGLAVLYSASGRELATVKKQAIFLLWVMLECLLWRKSSWLPGSESVWRFMCCP